MILQPPLKAVFSSRNSLTRI